MLGLKPLKKCYTVREHDPAMHVGYAMGILCEDHARALRLFREENHLFNPTPPPSDNTKGEEAYIYLFSRIRQHDRHSSIRSRERCRGATRDGAVVVF
jgi:hypothetical protein